MYTYTHKLWNKLNHDPPPIPLLEYYLSLYHVQSTCGPFISHLLPPHYSPEVTSILKYVFLILYVRDYSPLFENP